MINTINATVIGACAYCAYLLLKLYFFITFQIAQIACHVAHLNSISPAAWAVWAAIKKYRLILHIKNGLRHEIKTCMKTKSEKVPNSVIWPGMLNSRG